MLVRSHHSCTPSKHNTWQNVHLSLRFSVVVHLEDNYSFSFPPLFCQKKVERRGKQESMSRILWCSVAETLSSLLICNSVLSYDEIKDQSFLEVFNAFVKDNGRGDELLGVPFTPLLCHDDSIDQTKWGKARPSDNALVVVETRHFIFLRFLVQKQPAPAPAAPIVHPPIQNAFTALMSRAPAAVPPAKSPITFAVVLENDILALMERHSSRFYETKTYFDVSNALSTTLFYIEPYLPAMAQQTGVSFPSLFVSSNLRAGAGPGGLPPTKFGRKKRCTTTSPSAITRCRWTRPS